MCAWPGQSINRSFKLLSVVLSGFCDYGNINGKPVHCIFPDFLQQTESHYTHSSEHNFLDSSILGFLPVSNVIQLICEKQNFLHLAQAFLFIMCSFNYLITLPLQLNLCVFINDSFGKQVYFFRLFICSVQRPNESNSHIWLYFATELLKMERPQRTNNTVAFILISSASGGLCQTSSSSFPSHVYLLS